MAPSSTAMTSLNHTRFAHPLGNAQPKKIDIGTQNDGFGKYTSLQKRLVWIF